MKQIIFFLLTFLALNLNAQRQNVVEDFETDLTVNSDWTFYKDHDDDNGFQWTSDEAQEQTHSFYHASDDIPNGWSLSNPQESWMVSPVYYVTTTDAKVSFYYLEEDGGWFSSHPEFSVWISTTNGDPATNASSYVKLDDIAYSSDATWKKFEMTFPSDYMDTQVYIGIKYKGDNDNPMYVDNFFLGAPAPLPITVTDFIGQNAQQTNILTWNTEVEKNASHFEVQRSENGIDFHAIGDVLAKGTQSSYNYTDQTPNTLAYYRLKLIDYDGSYEYTNIISITQNESILRLNNVYPNPVQDELNIDLSANSENNIIYSLTNTLGQPVQHGQLDVHTRLHQVDVSNIPNGLYILQITNGSDVQTQQILKR